MSWGRQTKVRGLDRSKAMKPNSYSVQTQPKLGPQAVALTTSKAGSCYIGGLNVNIDLCAEIRLSCICSMTYRTQRQRGENGPSLGNGIGHDFFSASEGRNEMRRESILLRYDLRSSSKPLSCLVPAGGSHYKVWFVVSIATESVR